MAILDILHHPDPRLRNRAQPVEQVNAEIQTLVADLLETMYHAPGIGLAATQVNVHKRVLVIDISEAKQQPLCFINPLILEKTGQTKIEEGCLSVPGITDFVPRAEWIKVRALDENGAEFELETDGLLAICIQHEIDHLDGKLFIDHLSSIKRYLIRKKIEKSMRDAKDSA
ncbi:peptide deformylase [Achromatium sp. WMS2]|nr:peptide deformylase [Achromatium sp. WMS2]